VGVEYNSKMLSLAIIVNVIFGYHCECYLWLSFWMLSLAIILKCYLWLSFWMLSLAIILNVIFGYHS